ncbi:MAG: rhodanese-like domain-containing protein [Halothiobacillaceae bacterium]|jgi:rhodanese-related sulfurtransferase|nr:MAG: rhodanese-like domain-containing protein [Halothiobacillaceae bacterium]
MDPIDFLQRHWMLTAAAVGILFMLISSEVARFTRKYAEIGPSEASRMMSHDQPLLLDVREIDEYRAGYLRDAKHIPLGQLGAKIDQIEAWKDKPVIIYCRSGNRSGVACGQLAKQGFTKLYNLAGGILAWQHDGLPVKKK